MFISRSCSGRSGRSGRSGFFAARVLLLTTLVLGGLTGSVMMTGVAIAQEDPRVTAQNHYRAGQKAYAAGDYRQAIREFASAEQLLPSGFNDYNLGLCYDKLGEADPAIRYYRSYLGRVADAKNRAAVEASIARLEAALASASSKAEEQRRAEQARRDAEAKAAADKAAAKAAEEAAAKAAAEEAAAKEAAEEAARKAAAAATPANPDEVPPLPTNPVGTQGAPSTKSAPATGNPQLDRANAIDLDAIRVERAPLLGQPTAPAGAQGGTSAPSVPGSPTALAAGQDGQGKDKGAKAKEAPLYKKWWFWAIVGVSAYVVYGIATEESSSSAARLAPEAGASNAGATLLRW